MQKTVATKITKIIFFRNLNNWSAFKYDFPCPLAVPASVHLSLANYEFVLKCQPLLEKIINST